MKNNLQLAYDFAPSASLRPTMPDVEDKVSAIIQIDGRIPLFKRQGKDGKTWWDLPGGKPEPCDKNIYDTIIRELREELGIEAKVTQEKAFDAIAHPYKPGTFQQFILCEHVSGVARNVDEKDHLELYMATPEEAPGMLGNRISFPVAMQLWGLSGMTAANSPGEDRAKGLERSLKNG